MLTLKFPFCVVDGVLVIPTYEEVGTKEAVAAETLEAEIEVGENQDPEAQAEPVQDEAPLGGQRRKDTRHLIERAIRRLVRAGGRKTESDGAHLLEGIAVVVYDPQTGKLDE